MDRAYVVTGTDQEFEDFTRKYGSFDSGFEFVRILARQDLLGLDKPRVYFYGSYQLRRDWLKLRKEIRRIQSTMIVFDKEGVENLYQHQTEDEWKD